MPELIACPVCDCRVLVNEMQVGRRICCIGCGRAFVAGEPAPIPEPTTYSLHPEEEVPEEPEAVEKGVVPSRHLQPLCPKCHRPVGWEDSDCVHCGHLFDPKDRHDRLSGQTRRDALPHRGELICRLGGYAWLGGCLAVCTGPLAMVFALGCGLSAWWMAWQDLAGMDAELIDSTGRGATEAGRNKAVAGILLALLTSVFWTLALIVVFN